MARIVASFYNDIWEVRDSQPTKQTLDDYISDYNKIVDQSLIKRPTLDVLTSAILSTGNTSPGPDGIHFVCYRSLVDIAAPILLEVFDLLAAGKLPPASYNDGLLFLLEKAPTLLAEDTRPLSVTNTDNRIIARVASLTVMDASSRILEPCQKGFIPGRSGDDHLVDITEWFYSRCYNDLSAFILFLDTKRAFDSIDHSWIIAILRKLRYPRWFILLVKGLLHNVRVTPFFGSLTGVWIAIRRGVKQGCPLAPLLFAICYDYLIYSINRRALASPFAFADDLALATVNIASIIACFPVISEFSAMSGLGVHVVKTVVLASLQEDLPGSSTLLQNSTWPLVKLVDASIYLGITIGPKVTPHDVFAPFLSGFWKRLNNLKPYLLRMKVYDRSLVCNTYLTSMLAYPMRYYIMPKSLLRQVKEALRRICTPFNGCAHPYEFLTLPTKFGGLSTPLRCVEVYNDSLLASASPLIKSTGSLWDLPDPVPDGAYIEDTSIISIRRNAACVDFLCHHYGLMISSCHFRILQPKQFMRPM